MTRPFSQPKFMDSAYNCPYCDAYAKQTWFQLKDNRPYQNEYYDEEYMVTNYCGHCGKQSFWFEGKMVIPSVAGVLAPNVDLNEDIRKDYLEAASIATVSPRAAAALLRLAVQKVCKQLGESGKNIDADIGSLVSKGLPVKIQQALDIVRVIGNESVHPGEMNIKDDISTANSLFELVNVIADQMISQPKRIDELYLKLPEDKLKHIQGRDKA